MRSSGGVSGGALGVTGFVRRRKGAVQAVESSPCYFSHCFTDKRDSSACSVETLG